jgi:hypothetical protein
MARLLAVSIMLLAVAFAQAAPPAVPIGCSVIMYSSYDYAFQNGWSNCIASVESVKRTCGGTRINFIPTLYFGFNAGKLDRFCVDGGDGCASVRPVSDRG